MFKDISWANYGLFILISLLVYYITIGGLYCLNEIKQIFSGNSNLVLKSNRSEKLEHLQFHNTSIKEDVPQPSESNLNALADECMNDISNTLQHASKDDLVKEEIIYSLQLLINKYPLIKDSSFKSTITNYILMECKNYCSIHLSEEDLRVLWI